LSLLRLALLCSLPNLAQPPRCIFKLAVCFSLVVRKFSPHDQEENVGTLRT
jgi:hypothetical protein